MTTKQKNQNKFKKDKKIGGKALGSGGFGCLFKPALKCKGESKGEKGNMVTKLMLTKNANSEYEEITQFQKVLSHIPNYTDYFLVDNITICEPKALSNEDLTNYKEKCKALNKKDITENNVNRSLNKINQL
jgi:hypothetical protein